MTTTATPAVRSLRGPRRVFSVAVLLLVTCVAVACGGKVNTPGGDAAGTGGSARTAPRAANLTAHQLTTLVAKAATIKKLPADITPSLADAPTDFEDIKAGGRCADTSAPESGKCVYGDTKGSKLAVLYGDSHAGMWLTALDAAAKRAHWRVIMLSHAACPAPEFVYVDEKGKAKDCAAFRKVATTRIRALKPDLLVATGASPGERIQGNRIATAAEWERGWIKALKHLRTPGQKQVLLGDMPVLPKVNPDCLAAHLSNIQACGASRTAALEGVQIKAEQRAADAVNARYVDVVPWICSSICSPVIGDTIVFRNQFHITAAFARLLSGPLGRALGWRASRP